MNSPEETAPGAPASSFYEVLIHATPRLWVTPALVIVNVAYFAFAVLQGVSPTWPDEAALIHLGALYGPFAFDGEWWRLGTAIFVHIGFLHLAINMWALWNLGNAAERMFGNFTFFLIYVLSGIGGCVASLAWKPSILSAGASGAIFGLAGALLSMLYFGEILVPRPVVRSLLSSLAFMVAFNLVVIGLLPMIDTAGHVGGLVVGLCLGAALRRSLPSGFRPWNRYLSVPVTMLLLFAGAWIARERSSSDPGLLAENARRLAGEGNGAGALQALEKAVALAPESVELANALGESYLQAGRYDDAIASFERAVTLDPQLYPPQRNLAVALALAGRKEESQKALRIAQQMEPSDLSLYLIRSQLLLEANRLDEAVAVLDEALTWKPDSPEIVSQMGLVRLRRGENDLALEQLRKAVSIDPKNAENHNRLALGLARAREGDCGLEAIRKALEILTDAPHLLDSLGTVHLARGEAREAVEAYRRAVELDPKHAVYRYNLSLALERAGERAEAEHERAEALRLDEGFQPPADGEPVI
jgi:rhomboid protease GluP